MKIIKRIMIDLSMILIVVTATTTYSRFIKNVQSNGTINGKIVTASDLQYELPDELPEGITISREINTVQDAIDELASKVS